MTSNAQLFNRRNFLVTGTALATGFAGVSLLPQNSFAHDSTPAESIHLIGPKEGFSPHIGTMVSMMNWMRTTVLSSVQKLTMEELDHVHDENSNSIGSMLLHLVATEVFYQGNTFEGRTDFTSDEEKRLGAAMSLGEAGRKQIKGNSLDFYLAQLKETREQTITEFKNRDDQWLMKIDPKFFGGQPTNNYCKWFHVCEHESNHNGQIKFLKSRLPGRKEERE